MEDTQTNTKPARTAADICRNLRLGRAARGLLREGQKPGDYLTVLVEKGEYIDALRFMANALGPREVVWWSCLCVRHTAGDAMPAREKEALRAAVQWVLRPTAENRQSAKQASESAGMSTPAGAAARAAFLAGGNAPARAAKTASAAVLLAAARGKPSERSLTYRQFVSVGIDVDTGKARWAARKQPKGAST